MTTKEFESELLEIFNHKKALTEKIEYNTKLLLQIEAAYENDPTNIELKEKGMAGRKMLASQVSERNKLNVKKIAAQLGATTHQIRYRYNEFLVGKKVNNLQYAEQCNLTSYLSKNV